MIFFSARAFQFQHLFPKQPNFSQPTNRRKGGWDMTEHEKRFVWVKDKAGNEYVCRVDDLKDPKKVDEDDLKNCLDDASRALPIGD
jgi:hypothetical protein